MTQGTFEVEMVRRGPWAMITPANMRKIKESGQTQVPIRLKLKGDGGASEGFNVMLSIPKDNVRQMGGGFALVDADESSSPMSKYLKLLDYVIEQIGHEGPTSRSELNAFMKRELGTKFLGTFAAGAEPPFSYSQPYAIINTTNSPGEHWLAVVDTKISPPLVYDSFGRAVFVTKPDGTVKPVHTNREPEQRKGEDNCGQRAAAWLLLYHKFGRVTAKNI